MRKRRMSAATFENGTDAGQSTQEGASDGVSTSLDPNQPHLPGEDFEPTEAQRALVNAGLELDDVRERRMDLTKEEKRLINRCLALMHEHHVKEIQISSNRKLVLVPPDGKDKIKIEALGATGTGQMTTDDGEDDDDELAEAA